MVLNETQIAKVNEELQKIKDDQERSSLLNVIDKPKDFVQDKYLVPMLKKVFDESENVVQHVNILQMVMRMINGEKVDEFQRADLFKEIGKENDWQSVRDSKDRKKFLDEIAEKYSNDIANDPYCKNFKIKVKEEVERLSNAAN